MLLKIITLLTLVASTSYAQYVRDSAVVIRSYGISSISPITSSDIAAAEAQALVFEGMNMTDPRTLRQAPGLCELPEISADHLRFRYKIQKDARWSDNAPVLAEDIIFTFKNALNPLNPMGQPLRNYILDIQEVKKLGEREVEVVVRKANPWHAQILGEYVMILPKHIRDPNALSDVMSWAELHNDATSDAHIVKFEEFIDDAGRGLDPKLQVGSGAYKLQSPLKREEIVLERNDNYWGEAVPTKAAVPKYIVFREYLDEQSALHALRGNDLDIIDNVSQMLFEQLDTTSNGRLRKGTGFYNAYSYLSLNNDHVLFTDVRVRKALAAAIDREELVRAVTKGEAKAIEGPVNFTQPNYSAEARQETFDLRNAHDLFANAGWKPGSDGILEKSVDGKPMRFAFTVLVNSGNETRKQLAMIMASQLRKVGVDMNIKAVEWSVFLERMRSGAYEAGLSAWAGNATEDDVYLLWHSSQIANKGSNMAHYRSERADRALEMIRQSFDEEARYKLHAEFQRAVTEDQPVVFLFSTPMRLAWNKRLQNVEIFRQRPGYDPRYFRIGPLTK